MSQRHHRESEPAAVFALAVASMIAFVVVLALVVAAWWS